MKIYAIIAVAGHFSYKIGNLPELKGDPQNRFSMAVSKIAE